MHNTVISKLPTLLNVHPNNCSYYLSIKILQYYLLCSLCCTYIPVANLYYIWSSVPLYPHHLFHPQRPIATTSPFFASMCFVCCLPPVLTCVLGLVAWTFIWFPTKENQDSLENSSFHILRKGIMKGLEKCFWRCNPRTSSISWELQECT